MARKKKTVKTAAQLSEKELASLQEVKVSINLRGLMRAFNYVTYKMPFAVYHGMARKVEGVSKRMMVGNASLIGMPVGIVLRNGARSAYNISSRDNSTKYSWIGDAAGGLAVAGAVGASAVFGGPLAAAALGTGWMATWAGYAAATAVSGLVLHRPVFTAANLAVSTVLSATVAAASALIAAPANLLVGLRRSKASLKGYKLTEDQLAQQAAEFDRNSPTARYENQAIEAIWSNLSRLPHEKKEQFFVKLKEEFETATQPQEEKPQANAPKTGNTPQGPAQG